MPGRDTVPPSPSPFWRYGGTAVRRIGGSADRGNGAALRAVADAFGVPRRTVSQVTGATSRGKVIAIDPAPVGAAGTLATLRGDA
ncbi:MAG TPA: hypothetical protein VLJ59_17195 [Mycobacteriales bacterium]|nr:hypothetical protein [Mycobacteriales bacterium]